MARSSFTPTTVNEMRRAVKRAGYDVEQGRKHWKIRNPVTGGYVSSFATTPSDRNTIKNCWRDFCVRAGVQFSPT